LHGLLTKVMVDAVDLPLSKRLVQLAIQLHCRGAIVAEGLLHDDTWPWLVALVFATGEAGCMQEIANGRIEAGRRGEVEDVGAPSATLRIELLQQHGQALISSEIIELCCMVVQATGEGFPDAGIDGPSARELVDGLEHLLTKLLMCVGSTCDAHNGKLRRQWLLKRQIVEGWQQLAMCEVTGCAKDDHRAGGQGTGMAHTGA